MSAGWPGEPIAARLLLELNESLGSGCLGETFAAWHPATGERIAVTRFHAILVGASALERFEAEELPELRAFARPGIVPVSHFFRSGNDLAFAMPFLSGEDIRRYRSRPLAEILTAFDPLLESLAACHEAGFVHGGLRASNLLCDDQGTIQIAGLGFSALVHRMDGPRTQRIESPSAGLSPALRAGETKVSVADDVFAVGALLYEWVSGRPPPIESTGPQGLPPIALPGSEAPLPKEFRIGVAAMLDTDPARRPASIASVREMLAETRSRLPDDAKPEPHAYQRSSRSPGWDAVTTTSAPAIDRGQGAVEPVSNAVRNAWILLLSVVVLGAALLYWAESSVEPVSSTRKSDLIADSEEAAEIRAEMPSLGQNFADERRRAGAGELRTDLSDRLVALSARGAKDWAPRDLDDATRALETMDDAFEQNDFDALEAAASRVRGLTEAMEENATKLLVDSLDAGGRALEADDAKAATRHFELAAQLDPSSDRAARGLDRAMRRPEVLELMAEARREALRSAGLDSALRIAGRIPELDADYAPAKALIQDLQTRRAANALAGELSRHRERASAFEREERWSDAVSEYEAALAIRPDVAFAKSALPRARERASLDATIEGFLRDGDRVFSRTGREEAKRAIEAGSRVENPGPRLAMQLNALVEPLDLANTPVTVELLSDEKTEVTIFHVGRQGSFGRKPLELLPGDYTVVGTRKGYRDIRLRLNVKAGTGPIEFAVRCEEAL